MPRYGRKGTVIQVHDTSKRLGQQPVKDMNKIAKNMGEVPVRGEEFADILRRNER
jgi:hypothetical protein